MNNRKQAYYVVATAVEVLCGADEEDLGPHYVAEYQNVLNSLTKLRDRLSASLERADETVEVSLRPRTTESM
jgi:hypothetical protein